MELEQCVFLVTGAGSGLGEAVARAAVAGGARCVLADVNPESAGRVAGELGAGARAIACDVRRAEAGEAAVALARDVFGGLHVLVNCAGIASGEKVVGRNGPHGLEAFSRTIEINLVGSFNMLRLAAAAMVGNTPNAGGERGVIVNTASIAAFEGQIGQAAYSASKAGVVGMTLPAARELARHGIRVMTIAPGIFETPMVKGMSPELQEAIGRGIPFPSRLGRPEEFAALVRHIVGNPMLNGETIRLDGAVRLATG
ncbi:MAG: SDR family NAD(P)-dependent oxidoreductase [Proteobacteria bacterium]|nr:SDR family NAD(P)-dependent oxidoreductase [Pseudomonadota bacterium]HQR03078.1 SDR family NAD(P)-dependent oxidoreductase [Rhodocyclaceae bacterium]